MKYYKKPLVALTLLTLCVQSNADVLQTSVGANHATPKVIHQTQNSATSESLEINPYGKLSDVNQAQAESIGIDFEQNPFIYGSGYHDSESNLEYMGARYYSADMGRFMAQDSYDLINRYNYANANPIMYIDPDGHSAVGDLLLSMIPGYGTYHAFANDRPWYEKAIAIGMDVVMFVGMGYGLKSFYSAAYSAGRTAGRGYALRYAEQAGLNVKGQLEPVIEGQQEVIKRMAEEYGALHDSKAQVTNKLERTENVVKLQHNKIQSLEKEKKELEVKHEKTQQTLEETVKNNNNLNEENKKLRHYKDQAHIYIDAAAGAEKKLQEAGEFYQRIAKAHRIDIEKYEREIADALKRGDDYKNRYIKYKSLYADMAGKDLNETVMTSI